MGLIADRLGEAFEAGGNRTAIEFEGAVLTWAALARATDRVRSELTDAGIDGAVAVGLLGRNRLEPVAAFVAGLAAGRGVVLVNPVRPPHLVAEELRELGLAVVLATGNDFAPPVLAALCEVGSLALEVGVLGGELTLTRRIIPGAGPFRRMDAGTLIEIQTSGTTGKPKRLPVPESTMAASLRDGVRRAGGTVDHVELSPKTSPALMFSPLVHTSGTFNTLMAMFEVRPVVLFEKFDAASYRDAVVRHRPRFAPLPPTALRMLVDSDATREDFASVKAVRAGTAPLPVALQLEFEDKFGIPVLTTYGATEFMGAVASWSLDDHRAFADTKRGSVGRANKGCELRIVDPGTGEAMPTGEQGVLEARISRLDQGREWIRTTDLARIDVDGFLFIDGRTDDAIVRGGFKVMAGKVADLLKQAPGVRDAIVLGVPDKRLGEVPVAAVERYRDAQLDEASLRSFAKEHLTPYEVPVRIVVVDELPRTVSDKISRPDALRLFTETA